MAAADAVSQQCRAENPFATGENDDLKQLLTEQDTKITRRGTNLSVHAFTEKSLNECLSYLLDNVEKFENKKIPNYTHFFGGGAQ